MKKQRQKKKKIYKILTGCLISSFMITGFFIINLSSVEAFVPIITQQPTAEAKFSAKWSWEKVLDQADKAWKKAGSVAFWSAMKSALNTIAYDTATWIGSGGEGQKPMFITEGWDKYLGNVADNAAGTFIESIGETWNFNLCEPDFALKAKIGLGLVEQQRPGKPACTFSEMKENWEEELSDPNFLPKFQNMFEPTSSDLGIALSLQTGIMEEIRLTEKKGELERIENKGWLDISNIAGERENPPGHSQSRLEQTKRIQEAGFMQNTEDAFEAAANIFINQLAITAFNRFIESLGKKSYTEPYAGDYGGFTDYEAGPTTGGIAGAKERFRKLIEPDFTVRGDYDILAELTMCPNPTKAGPTNCVIEDKFRRAIENRMTVGEAMDEGYLNSNWTFGFTADGLEPEYNGGYPYRSMIILRKFRILPVGWELAAQYIKDFLGETKNLGDLVACFNSNDDYDGYYDSWCDGLVNPNWVLKAPLNYCKREGPGPEIVSEQVMGEGKNSELAISRNDSYCADEQTCIKEHSDGSCELYGYCTEERSQWNFNSDSCEPKYNTCQTFRSREGRTVSYLENSLDYSICSIDNVGCQPYATSSNSYNSDNDNVAWNNNYPIYFDKDAEECDVGEEGCSEFIRIKPGLGVNIFRNSSFEEEESGWTRTDTDAYDGWWSIQLDADWIGAVELPTRPAGFDFMDETITFSLYLKDCGNSVTIGVGNSFEVIDTTTDWQRYEVSYFYSGVSTVDINVEVSGIDHASYPNCLMDAVQIERGRPATVYHNYRGNGLVYEKILPDYLESICYESASDFQYKDNAPNICYNYARKCNIDEVGCALYTSVTDGFSVPARLMALDYCVAECVGYDTYIQSETNFNSTHDEYFIPSLAQSCSAEAVGCDEFTNLDKLEQGGEAREYYTYLRQCLKPTEVGADCAEFYTWEGSDDTGFQLRVFSLQQDIADINSNGITDEPTVTSDDSSKCNETIYHLPAADPAYNADCREFYNRDGDISYHLYTRTITCSENCHPYRRTDINYDPSVPQTNCTGSDKHWDSSANECIVCKNNGYWNSQHQACIYNAIPGQGMSCSAGQDGCREYSGNAGANMMILFTNDFEDGTNQGWIGGVPSSDSVIVGEHSLRVDDSATATVGVLVERNKSYVVSFVAKSGGAGSLEIKFVNGSSEENIFGSVSLNSAWRFYEVNLANLDHEVSIDESLVISGSSTFYIDNIRLTEIVDCYFLIKDSWTIPESCNQDIDGNPYPLYMLGCDEYQDQKNNTYYLRDFNRLCQESAVGCELMINTHNFSDFYGLNSATNPVISVPQDSFIYAAYDEQKECYQSDKGCQRLGMVYQYGSSDLFSDVYLKNNPDEYDGILCDQQAVGCEEWYTNEGNSYFKDPGDMVCQWRQQAGAGTGGWGWWKKPVNRCDDDGDNTISASTEVTLCLDDNDCGTATSCILDSNDYACPVIEYYQTFGYGGAGNVVEQPWQDADGNWTGLCPADQAGCTELIDPISKFSINAIFNSDLDDFQDVDNNGQPDGWNGSSQEVKLSEYTLYRLAIKDDNFNNSLTIDCSSNIYQLGSDNNLTDVGMSLGVAVSAGEKKGKLFYSAYNSACTISVSNISGQTELKQAVVDYQLRQDLDKATCNGIVDFEQGCVLFNERRQNGASLAILEWDADLTIDDGNGVAPKVGQATERDSNILFKVTPDRVCNQWLACRSYIKDENDNNVCFDIGLCDSVDENGNCSNFVLLPDPPQNQTYPNLVDANKISNLSGYSKAGYSGSSQNTDYYPLGSMEQVGGTGQIDNGGFEIAGNNDYPVGWNWEGGAWDKGVFRVIDNPIEAQNEGVGYPQEGKNFLKLGSTYSATSEFIDVVGSLAGTDYILTSYINTINLSTGTAEITIEGFDSNEISQGNIFLSPSVVLAYGNSWIFKLGKFIVGSNVNKIKITLSSDSSAVGNFYFDDIKIAPALEAKDLTPTVLTDDNFWYMPQSCRLYPEDNALSCQYYDDSGLIKKGWSGYCLEYDHYPGSEDACLLWYPIDKVLGEGIEEGSGYSDKVPVYYCLEAEAICDDDEPKLYCDKLVQTVTSVGQNKYWAGRTYEGSDYVVPFAISSAGAYMDWGINYAGRDKVILNYTRDDQPFGSVVPLEPVSNPYEWDSEENTEENTDIQPLYVFHSESGITDARAGTPYAITGGSVSCLGQITDSGYLCAGANTGNWSADLGIWDNCTWSCVYPGGCSASVTHNADYNWFVSASDNTGNEDCDYVRVYCYNEFDYNINDDVDKAIDGVKRLFAQSYGAWEWNGTCQGGVDNMTEGRDCADNSFCQCYDCVSDCSSIGSGMCVSQSNVHCNLFYCDTSGGWDGATFHCVDENGQDNHDVDHIDDCRTDDRCNDWSRCVGGFNNNNPCNSNSNCSFDDGVCVGGPKAGQSCTSVTSDSCICYECDKATCVDGTCSGGICTTETDNGQSGNACSEDYECACRLSTCQDGECNTRYTKITNNPSYSWDPPDALCTGGTSGDDRPIYDPGTGLCDGGDCFACPSATCDYCAVLPAVSNIKVNSNISDVTIVKNGFINLTFNSLVDSQQLPLVMYAVNWGDNEDMVVTGVEMSDRPNPDNPHSLYHLYSYWDLKAKHAVDQTENTVYCGADGVQAVNYNGVGSGYICSDSACCVIQPRVKIKDNWGWCNGGTAINDCNHWEAFGSWIVVTEK